MHEGQRITGVKKFGIDLKYLWLEQMLEVRANWYLYVLFSVFLPIVMVFGFTRIGRGLTDQISLLFIISGAIIFSLASDGIYGMALRISEMKRDNALIFYATLPISRVAFILALVLARLVITLPGMVAPILFGMVFYDFAIQPHLILLILLPLISLCFALVGLVIGAAIADLNLVQMIVNALLFVLVMASPVFIPGDALPLPLRVVSYVLPSTHAASALRAALISDLNSVFWIHLLVLVCTLTACIVLLARYWRLN